MTATLVVIGAINVDLVVSGAALPSPGQTITGGTFARHDGGKGGNQAVAAARALSAEPSSDAGAHVALIGAVGTDDLGLRALSSLAADGVSTSVAMLEDEPTGVALIIVNEDGENLISVAPGANARVTARQVEHGLDEHRPGVILASLEVPEEAVRAAGEWSRSHDVAFVLNPAPAQPWAQSLLAFAGYITPNEGELQELGAIPAEVTVLETRGAGGVRIHGDPNVDVPAPRVAVVDTTGAGDCFNGVVAAGLLEGIDLQHAVRRAVVAAALSTTMPGAREGMPTRAGIDAAIGRRP